jgi:pimeloyl-ACP methyl ester carboxylesterase
VQFEAIIPLLTDPAAHGLPGPAFDVVAPSLVGYGFSDPARRPGMSVAAMAPVMHRLMTEVLGYERYGIRSSDLGAGVAAQMALRFPDAVIGSHTGGTNPFLFAVPDDLTEEERAFVKAAQAWGQGEMAYAQEHSTKPQTLAVALNDSPAGLLSWIVEKQRRWSDVEDETGERDLSRAFTPDEVLPGGALPLERGH